MKEAAREGLKFNARKCKTMRTEFAGNRESIGVNCEEVEDVEEFAYCWSYYGQGRWRQ